MKGSDEERNFILMLDISTTSWIVLMDYLQFNADFNVYEKVIVEYLQECPAWKMSEILLQARKKFMVEDFQKLVDIIFKYKK